MLPKFKFSSVLLLFALSVTFVASPSFAQTDACAGCVQILPEHIDLYKKLFPLTVWTESQEYAHGSVVEVTGHLRPENSISPVLVVVTDPLGNIITVDQITPDSNGDFSLDLNTQSSMWKQDGDYVVKVQSGSNNRQFKTMFSLISTYVGNASECTTDEISAIASNGDTYCISYTSSDGVTFGAQQLDLDTKTLLLELSGGHDDSVTLHIPRHVLDSRSPSGDDSAFIVLHNGEIIEHLQLESTSYSRLIKIGSPLESGVYEIIGTHVIPEFGPFSFLILVGSIVPILILGRLFSNRIVKF